jgi:hypothetical protein
MKKRNTRTQHQRTGCTSPEEHSGHLPKAQIFSPAESPFLPSPTVSFLCRICQALLTVKFAAFHFDKQQGLFADP